MLSPTGGEDMGRGRWQTLAFGVAGVATGAWAVRAALPPPPPQEWWPVPAVVQRVAPSVVLVQNMGADHAGRKTQGIGSGVVLNRNGDVVTNYHVVQGAATLNVVVDGRKERARLLGSDPVTDLAVIQVRPGAKLVPITFARSSAIRPGQLVVAIGNSLGFSKTVTAGVISAKDRVLFRDGWEYHLIQTDAAINPGNSGGPLLNADGQLIGINSSKISQAGVEGIGFAIPSDTVRTVVDQILRYGHVRRPWLGVAVRQTQTPAIGLFVVAVQPGSPAEDAGIRPGDFIWAIDGRRVRTTRDLYAAIERLPVGARVRVEGLRAASRLTFRVRLGALPWPAGANRERMPARPG